VDLDAPIEAFVGLLSQLISSSQRKNMGNVARQKVLDHFSRTDDAAAIPDDHRPAV
jgi:hypothetical protein